MASMRKVIGVTFSDAARRGRTVRGRHIAGAHRVALWGLLASWYRIAGEAMTAVCVDCRWQRAARAVRWGGVVGSERPSGCSPRRAARRACVQHQTRRCAPVDDSAHEARTGAHPVAVGLQVERHAALVRHRHSLPFRARHVGKAALGGSVRGERDLQGVGVLDRQAQCPQLTGTWASCTADNARADTDDHDDHDDHDYPLSVPGCVRAARLPVWVNPV